MVTHQLKDVCYRLGIVKLPSELALPTEPLLDGNLPEGSVIQTWNLALRHILSMLCGVPTPIVPYIQEECAVSPP